MGPVFLFVAGACMCVCCTGGWIPTGENGQEGLLHTCSRAQAPGQTEVFFFSFHLHISELTDPLVCKHKLQDTVSTCIYTTGDFLFVYLVHVHGF